MYSAFKQGMRELGWLEGKNVEYRFLYADGDVDRLDALAGELIGRQVEVIVAGSSSAARAAQRATKTIPIVSRASARATARQRATVSVAAARLARDRGLTTGSTRSCRGPLPDAGTFRAVICLGQEDPWKRRRHSR